MVVSIVALTQRTEHRHAVVIEILDERAFKLGVGNDVTDHARTHVGNLRG